MSKVKIEVLFNTKAGEYNVCFGGLFFRDGKLVEENGARHQERFFRHADRIYKILEKQGNVKASYL